MPRKPPRRQAAKRRRRPPAGGVLRRGGAGAPPTAPASLLHDLQVHQAELELQNEELRRARLALEEARDEYLDLYAFAPVGYFTCRDEGRVAEVNHAGAGLLGLTRRDILGRAFAGFVAPADRARWTDHHDAVLRTSAPLACELLVVKAGGETVPVELTSVRREAASGGPGLVLSAVQDVTERARTARELEAATRRTVEEDRRKAHFLAVLSHELRNPLAAIRSGLQILDRAPPGSEPDQRARSALHRQAEHLARLVDDLLDITRISHGKIELQVARIDARDTVRRACDDSIAAFEQRGVTLRCSLAEEPAWVDADAIRLAQMIGNLLHNALKFSAPEGRVRVIAGTRDGCFEVAVADDGPGIEPGDLDRIFEPFVQAARPHQGAPGGLGIGLALVRELAAQHGGTARATSGGRGHGSEFVIRLPLAGGKAEAPALPAAAPRCAPLSVLIVEDDEDAGSTLADLLALEGHSVRVARSGSEGVVTAARTRPDVLICDVGLPDMSGYDVIRNIRAAAYPVAPFAIALTGYAQPEDRHLAKEAGFDAHLPKPTLLEDLHPLLTRAARQRIRMAHPRATC